MIPVFMASKHNPPASYGDCWRACIASLLEIDDAPHFFFDGPDEQTARERVEKYLRETHSLGMWATSYTGLIPLPDLLKGINEDNPGALFILVCGIEGVGEHAIIAGNGRVMHDPAYWPVMGDYVPPSSGNWTVCLLVPAVCYASGEL